MQQGNDALGIGQFARPDETQGGFEGHGRLFDDLVVVEGLGDVLEVKGGKQVDSLVGKAGGSENRPQRLDPAGPFARLLLEDQKSVV